MANSQNESDKKLGYFWLYLLFTVQIFCLVLINQSNAVVYEYNIFPTIEPRIFVFISTVFIVGVAVLAYNVINIIYNEAKVNSELKSQVIFIQNLEELVASVRAQRHDFVNHIQALYGLLRTNSYQDAMEYIQQIYDEVRQDSDLLRMQPREVGALLHAKVGLAAARGVEVRVKMDAGMAGMPMRAKDLNRILGNLIDNAVDALEGRLKKDRWVQVRMEREGANYILKVSNGGPPIPPDLQKRIFQPGYTTKDKDRHSGVGLYAVQEIARRYQGKVELVSNTESGTCFTITVPAPPEGKDEK